MILFIFRVLISIAIEFVSSLDTFSSFNSFLFFPFLFYPFLTFFISFFNLRILAIWNQRNNIKVSLSQNQMYQYVCLSKKSFALHFALLVFNSIFSNRDFFKFSKRNQSKIPKYIFNCILVTEFLIQFLLLLLFAHTMRIKIFFLDEIDKENGFEEMKAENRFFN